MSQGQKKRVALAKSLTEEASLYLWDEPANYLDLFNQDQLIKLLAKEQPAMLLVDHDRLHRSRRQRKSQLAAGLIICKSDRLALKFT